MKKDLRTCEACKGVFICGASYKGSTCPDCRKKEQLEKNAWRTRERECLQCKTKFLPFQRRQHYCCRACREAAIVEQARKERGQRLCPVCGTRFTPQPERKVYCSVQCREVGYKLRRKARDAQYKKGGSDDGFSPESL